MTPTIKIPTQSSLLNVLTLLILSFKILQKTCCDIKDVKISTADKIATDILREFNYSLDVVEDNLLEKIVKNSRKDPRISANEVSNIAHLTNQYLSDEIL